MPIQLSEQSEQFVRDLVRSGRFASEAEVIERALRLLEEHDEQARIDELRQEIAIGIDQADRGEAAPFDPRNTLERVRIKIGE